MTAAAHHPKSDLRRASLIGGAGRTYRPDIDGLRAIAVSLVLLFHVGFNGFSGGYVGVDVFFVISGYLIVGHIVNDMALDRWSTLNFYASRARRLIPALAAMIATVTILGIKYLLPAELVTLEKSAIPALLGIGNIYFSLNLDYFSAPAQQQAFLHTWSLGVEEQFYLFIPILLAAILRYNRSFVALCLAALCISSLVCSQLVLQRHPSWSFYWVSSRAWELLLGGILAVYPKRLELSRPVASLAGLAGLGGILIPVYVYSEATAFPGLNAIPPCVGAVAVIAAGRDGDNYVSRILGSKPFVAFGLISYSVYLWHWPILFYQQYGLFNFGHLPPRIEKLFTLCVMIAFGGLSWALIERPTRHLRPMASAQRVVIASVSALSLISVLALAIIASDGLPSRFSKNSLKLASFLKYGGDPKLYRAGVCFMEPSSAESFIPAQCLSYTDPARTMLVVGDSHAAHLIYGLQHEWKGETFLQATGSRCFPSLGSGSFPACAEMMRYVLTEWLPHHGISRVIFASSTWDRPQANDIAAAVRYVRAMGIPVTIIGPIPSYTQPLPRLLAFSKTPSPAAVRNYLVDRSSDEAAASHLGMGDPDVQYVSLRNMLCHPDDGCTVFADAGLLLQSDRNHLTPAGSDFVAKLIVPKIEARRTSERRLKLRSQRFSLTES